MASLDQGSLRQRFCSGIDSENAPKLMFAQLQESTAPEAQSCRGEGRQNQTVGNDLVNR